MAEVAPLLGSFLEAQVESNVTFEACGSPGEVSNDPTYGNRFGIAWASYRRYEQDKHMYREADPEHFSSMVWTRIALEAPDQLQISDDQRLTTDACITHYQWRIANG